MCCDFLFNVLSNYLTFLLLTACSHRVAKVDGTEVFYKAFLVRHWVQSPKEKIRNIIKKVCMTIKYTRTREGLIS